MSKTTTILQTDIRDKKGKVIGKKTLRIVKWKSINLSQDQSYSLMYLARIWKKDALIAKDY